MKQDLFAILAEFFCDSAVVTELDAHGSPDELDSHGIPAQVTLDEVTPDEVPAQQTEDRAPWSPTGRTRTIKKKIKKKTLPEPELTDAQEQRMRDPITETQKARLGMHADDEALRYNQLNAVHCLALVPDVITEEMKEALLAANLVTEGAKDGLNFEQIGLRLQSKDIRKKLAREQVRFIAAQFAHTYEQ